MNYSRVRTQWIFKNSHCHCIFHFFHNYIFKELLSFINHPFTSFSSIKSTFIKCAQYFYFFCLFAKMWIYLFINNALKTVGNNNKSIQSIQKVHFGTQGNHKSSWTHLDSEVPQDKEQLACWLQSILDALKDPDLSRS